MPWKDGYTISDEKSLADADIRWPDGKALRVHIVVDLSIASGPGGHIGAATSAARPAAVRRRRGARPGAGGARQAWAQGDLRGARGDGQDRPGAHQGAHRRRPRGGGARLRHEDVSALPRAEEKARIELTTSILTDVTGRRPAGWFSLPRQSDPFAGGTISPNTMDLLIEAGFAYMGNGLADDIPHYWVTDFASRRAILTLPYYYHFDDQFFCMFPRAGTGSKTPTCSFATGAPSSTPSTSAAASSR